ncbi:DNA polymerase III subunit gamma/tau [Methylophilaceae bacterium]|jgi:DNA polymerase III subunit gamma/tau|nr:DNA polymerase III subunit gamma/tau [Methylophilaceae bacterium]
MSYEVLARKWRPKSFEGLVGQDNTVQALSNALDNDRLHHAYLFTGTRGVGKTTIARILAKSLNCELSISSKPCQKCSICNDIDKGRFIDLIEVDAASNTQVDNMRDLLENSQYAPTSGRFKVYIIDEVHMLSKSAFNAMLKTLEEPPSHVKFILATTDPKKVPVTVISRCIQFNLKQMTTENISGHLKDILKEEKINAEDEALEIIAKAAHGSMRDGLSILDQAIAYSGTDISSKKIISMLGTIDDIFLVSILNALAENNGSKVMELSKEMNQKSISFDLALGELARLVHKISIHQIIPDSLKDSSLNEEIKKLSTLFTAESLQLSYQIAINGRKDLHLAPDQYTGFNMTLLRMLAFYPTTNSVSGFNSKKKIEAEVSVSKKVLNFNDGKSSEEKNRDGLFDGDWGKLVSSLQVGIAKSLAQESELINYQDNTFNLFLNEKFSHLNQNNYVEKLEEVLIDTFNKKIKVNISLGNNLKTPSSQKKIKSDELMKKTESAIMDDEFVKQLINDFDAEVVTSSIEPTKKKEN